ncbi:DNA cytosine methyltransferase [Actinomadura rudentiformis]|uniref:Cytosine-specific methyltransferase n=1 Tax=Actinomadura rudentiformis TaxID=359158 RepID=A0A6H9Y7Z4_9ACTN|nr:DNA (cytosine-5-)-methyltransferase [Actinomadura rudentiformis]KAB2340891.1 DNA (cytosine-5-)-methyltransferase [Actinomadura rudentiformis]
MHDAVVNESAPRVAGLFAGIGGLELGLRRGMGAHAAMLCEWWEPAQAVLQDRFPGVPLHDDVQTLQSLPDVEVVTAGFPCTDLSQAGRTAGIEGAASGMVRHLFELLADSGPTWVVIENVRNMLALDGGRAMEYLVSEFERLQFRWAYRLVDSRFTGVPQRRQRVIMLASRTHDPRSVLFSDDVAEPSGERYRDDAHGFYWTEGRRGLGWAKDALPTLKGGSGLGIPSPPALWVRDAEPGRAIVTPSLTDAEDLQGFPRGWTEAAQGFGRSGSARWKLVGNAVTVGVAEWLGRRLGLPPGTWDDGGSLILPRGTRWPAAAWGDKNERWEYPASMWPEVQPYRHLLDVVDQSTMTPLSLRATSGFYGRLQASSLRYDENFALAVKQHAEFMEGNVA